MGRPPSEQPPGRLSVTRPHRASIPPKNRMDDRMARIHSTGISRQPSSIRVRVRVLCCLSTAIPRWRRIWQLTATSLSVGQFSMTERRHSTAAERMGSTAFLAPCAVTVPANLFPPTI